MPRVRLTDISITKLPQSKVRVTYWDESLPAFGVRVGARRKTFIVVVDGGHRIKLGNYPRTTLKDARREAHHRLSGRGVQATVEDAPTCGSVVEDFIKIHHAQSRPKTLEEQQRLLSKHFLKVHRETPLNRITAREILAITDGLMEVPSEQLHAYRALKTFFKWAVKRKLVPVSPMEGLEPPNKPADRDRVLSDKELVAVYRTARKVGYPFGHIVLIIVHTAMRRGEVGALKRSYVTENAITLPGELTKNGRELVLPNLINAELASIQKVGESEYYFPNTTGGPFGSWAKNKAKFDMFCGVSNWTLHDIRRTVRTKLSEWSCCDDATAERILGHISSESRVSRIYNRWKHFPQMKTALEKYEERLATLLKATETPTSKPATGA
jgi:integrase